MIRHCCVVWLSVFCVCYCALCIFIVLMAASMSATQHKQMLSENWVDWLLLLTSKTIKQQFYDACRLQPVWMIRLASLTHDRQLPLVLSTSNHHWRSGNISQQNNWLQLLHLRQRVVHSRSCRSISLRSVIACHWCTIVLAPETGHVPVTFVFSWRPGDCACKPGICWANFFRLRFAHGWTPQQDGEIARNESVFETQFSHNRVTLQWLSFLAGLNY